MVESTEIRIGNLIWDDSGNEITIDTFVEVCPNCDPFIDLNKCEPIPLTEEWLVKFGFENKGIFVNKLFMSGRPSGDMDGAILFQVESAKVYFINGVFHYEISSSDDDYGANYDTKKIEYAHQLQNLYFALTGEELTIK